MLNFSFKVGSMPNMGLKLKTSRSRVVCSTEPASVPIILNPQGKNEFQVWRE